MSTRDAGQVRGHPNTDATQRADLAFQQATTNKLASGRAALDVAALGFAQLVAADAAEASCTTSVINATAHSALVGDVVIFTGGNLNRQMFTVYSVAANTITLGQTASEAPANTDTFDILRFAIPRVDSAGGVRIGTVSGTVTADTELPAAAALADNTATPTAPAVGSFGMLWDGSTWDRAKGDSTDGALVNLGSNNDVTVTSGSITANAGTNLNTSALSTEATLSTLNGKVTACNTGAVVLTTGTASIGKLGSSNDGIDIGNVDVAGGQGAHDSAVTGFPVHIGAEALSADRTAVTTGDATRLLASLLGKLITYPYCLPQKISYANMDVNTSGDKTMVSAPGAGTRVYVTSIAISNLHASTTSIATMKDGSTTFGTVGLPFNSNISIEFPVPIRCADNSAFTINLSASVQTNAIVGYFTATE